MPPLDKALVLITGATGYVGRQLLAAFEEERQPVRCFVRDPKKLNPKAPSTTEIVQGDVMDPASLAKAMVGVDTAYYLIHSMETGGDFAALERQSAELLARTAKKAGVRRVVFLGGLGEDGPALSAHLRSRHEVGESLRREGPLTIEFRAAVIIGSGSVSFEIIQALVERLPVMVTPRWVDTSTQPIGIQDVLKYLLAAREIPLESSRIFEIGGPEKVSYGDLMREYARQRGLHRWMIRVPVLTPRLSSLWLTLVTPVNAPVGRKLVEGLRNPTVVRDPSAQTAFSIRPAVLSNAIAQSLSYEAGRHPLQETFTQKLTALPQTAFAVIERIGGANGWYFANFLWKLRGTIDHYAGGVGWKRVRRDPNHLRVGDILDFWRVEAIEEGHLLRLRAEMKLPGRAWLEFSLTDVPGGSVLRQTASFDPLGVSGLLYWYALYSSLDFQRDGAQYRP
jgi:uncharacterized protein YbjT (DUF2867 family)